MKLTDTIRRAARSLGNAKGRTILTALAIAVGAFTLTATFAASKGATDYTNDLISNNFDPAEVIIAKDPKLLGGDGFSLGPQEYEEGSVSQGGLTFKQLTLEEVEKIESTEGVESVRREYQLVPQYVTREGQKKYTGEANVYSPSQVPELAAGNVKNGVGDNEVLISDAYLGLLGFGSASEAIGKEISIIFQRPIQLDDEQIQQAFLSGGMEALQNLKPFETREEKLTVVAVSKKAATALAADTAFKISPAKAEELSDFVNRGTERFQKYILVYAKIRDGENKALRDAIVAKLKESGFTVQTVESTQATLTQFIDILTGIVLGFGSLVLIASVFGIINTQYISVLERTREIGLNKALGMSRSSVMRLFLIEAAWIGFIGGALGAGLAVLIGTLTNPWLSTTIGFPAGQYLLVFEPLSIAGVIALLTVIAMIAGLLPALKAAKLDPIEALRTE